MPERPGFNPEKEAAQEDDATREPSEDERKEARRKELAEWVSNLEKQLSLPEGRIRSYAIEVGGKTAKQYETELTKAGFKVDYFAKQILEKAKFSEERGEMDIVRLTVADLGFTNGATNREIWQRGKEIGLDLCPPDVGPELRLSMKDQPLGDYVTVAMEGIPDSDGNPLMFHVYSNDYDGRGLDKDYGHPENRQKIDCALAFVRRKP